MTADLEAMMTTDHLTDTATDTDTMMGDKEHILVEGKHRILFQTLISLKPLREICTWTAELECNINGRSGFSGRDRL